MKVSRRFPLLVAAVASITCFLLLPGCRSKVAPEVVVETSEPSVRSRTVVPRSPLDPKVEYVSLDPLGPEAQAVVVQGYPLVHTRQVLARDTRGESVGEESVQQQIDQVMADLEAVLKEAGSGFDRLVRLNIYADSNPSLDLFRAAVSETLPPTVRPAITAVVSRLPQPGASVAVDAVAAAAPSAVNLKRCESVDGDASCADAAIMPRGGVVYVSGHVDKSPLAQAADKVLAQLLQLLEHLKLDRSQVVQLKVFVRPVADADQVLLAIKRAFPDQLTPPVVFVEWIASAPVEIEMIVSAPLSDQQPDRGVRFYTPPEVKASPTFSRVAVVDTEQQIYISGLSPRDSGDGTAQVSDVFEQLKSILAATGSDLSHLAKATYYVSDEDSSAMLNELRLEYYDPDRPPAASKVMVHGVGRAQRSISMDMIAVAKSQ